MTGTKPPKLGIGDGLTDDPGHQNNHTQDILYAQPGQWIPRCEQDRHRKGNADECLLLQEPEHAPRRIGPPVADQLGIARIVGNACGPSRDVQAEPERPNDDQECASPWRAVKAPENMAGASALTQPLFPAQRSRSYRPNRRFQFGARPARLRP